MNISLNDETRPEIETAIQLAEMNDNDIDNDEGEIEIQDKPKRKKKKTSKMWLEFKEVEYDENGRTTHGECNHCKAIIKVASGTSGMKNHLDGCRVYQAKLRGEEISFIEKQLPFSPVNHITRPKSFSIDRARRLFAEMMILDELPLSFTEKPGFAEFVEYIAPDFNKRIFERESILADIVHVKNEMRTVVQKELDHAKSRISYTLDVWTSKYTMVSYMIVTAHFISRKWKYVNIILCVKSLPPHYTGVDVNEAVISVMTDWRLLAKFMAITIDDAAYTQTFLTEFSIWDGVVQFIRERLDRRLLIHVKCFAGILNQLAETALEMMSPSVEGLRHTIRKLTTIEETMQTFTTYCDQVDIVVDKMPSVDVPTRWDTTNEMFELSIPYFPAFEKWFQSNDAASDQSIEAFDMSEIEDLHTLLSLLKNMTDKVSNHDSFSMHKGLSNIFVLREKLHRMNIRSSTMRAVKDAITDKFSKYFEGATAKEDLLVYYIASIFNPSKKANQIKSIFTEAMAEANKIISWIKQVYKDNYQVDMQESNHDNRKTVTESLEVDEFDTIFAAASSTNDLRSEIDVYLEEPVQPVSDSQIIDYWRVNSARFPNLTKMAVDFLCIQQSSVATAFAFSGSDRVMDSNRSNLGDDLLETMLTTKSWLISRDIFQV